MPCHTDVSQKLSKYITRAKIQTGSKLGLKVEVQSDVRHERNFKLF